MWDLILDEMWMLSKILLAAVLGFAIGLERRYRNKEAGIRTHTIVCIGSALLTAVSMYGFGPDADGARVAAQIVSGVGFLGAGIIVYRHHEVKGLTTAAGVWAAAGVGMACGTGMYILAIGSTAIMVGMQFLQHAKIKPFKIEKTYSIHIRFRQTGDSSEKIKAAFSVEHFTRLVLEQKEGEIWYSATLQTEEFLHSDRLNEIMRENPYIQSIERADIG